MKYLLDTNICIRYLNRRSARIIRRMDAELIFGAMKSNNPEKTRNSQREFLEPLSTLPFDDAAAEHYGRIRAELEIAGTPIGPNDLLIAAIALTHGLIVVTHNTREFSRINGLKIEDWEDEAIG